MKCFTVSNLECVYCGGIKLRAKLERESPNFVQRIDTELGPNLYSIATEERRTKKKKGKYEIY